MPDEEKKMSLQVDCSCGNGITLLRRLRDLTPLASFNSVSSGGSERGLELAVRGLEGGLGASAAITTELNRKFCPEGEPLTAGDKADKFRARSQKCS